MGSGISRHVRATINRLIGRSDLIQEAYLEEQFKVNNIYNIASGEEDNIMKMYFYGKVVPNPI
jgi:AP-4 complex subunit beta-1